jgi:hypothetical protein
MYDTSQKHRHHGSDKMSIYMYVGPHISVVTRLASDPIRTALFVFLPLAGREKKKTKTPLSRGDLLTSAHAGLPALAYPS